jgi:plastocyanin
VTGSARFFWAPAKVAIAPGGSVTWAWSGDSYHDVEIEALGYSSGIPVKEGAYTVTFPVAGAYAVSCSVHPDTMRGTVTVE